MSPKWTPGIITFRTFGFFGRSSWPLGSRRGAKATQIPKSTQNNTNIKVPRLPQMPKLMQNTANNEPETIKVRLQIVKPNADNLRQNSSYEMPSLTWCLPSAQIRLNIALPKSTPMVHKWNSQWKPQVRPQASNPSPFSKNRCCFNVLVA